MIPIQERNVTLAEHIVALGNHIVTLPETIVTLSETIVTFPEHMVTLPEHMVVPSEHMAAFCEHVVAFPDRLIVFQDWMIGLRGRIIAFGDRTDAFRILMVAVHDDFGGGFGRNVAMPDGDLPLRDGVVALVERPHTPRGHVDAIHAGRAAICGRMDAFLKHPAATSSVICHPEPQARHHSA
ncbi:MAG TPA: hypothetical protein VEK57_06530 [Thermoanaerobaculia bacterium]|nr:hypothetical protein [Thermoanaerobaculia bacterium]